MPIGLIERVTALPFVQHAEGIDNKLLVRLADPERHNPTIIRTLVETGANIQFVGEMRYSLERMSTCNSFGMARHRILK